MRREVPAATPTRLAPAEREAVDAAVRRVLESGPWIGGPEIAAFESDFAAWLGVGDVVGCASGTDALVLAMTALELPAGSEVLVPAHDGGYAAVAARLAGLVPVAVDVAADTAAPGIAELEAALGTATRPSAVIITHLHGDAVPLDEVGPWCRAHGLRLIEDAAQALGARVGDRAAGTTADAGAFSFYPTKNLGAAGDAGAVWFADAQAAARARSLAQYGWGDRFVIERPGGRNSRLDPVQAAVLRARLPFLAQRNARRVEVRERYRAAAPHLGHLGGGAGSVAHHAVLRSTERDRLATHLAARGVGSAIHYPVALGDMPGTGVAGTTPEARRLCGEVLSVPCTPELTDDEVDAVCAALAGWEGE